MSNDTKAKPAHRGGWIGVDLDGTIAEYHGFVGPTHIGKPIPLMTFRVKTWLAQGKDVRIFTARVGSHIAPEENAEVRKAIEAWCLQHLGQVLPITNAKDFQMIELWDDRAVQVIPNTGQSAVDHAIMLRDKRDQEAKARREDKQAANSQ